MKRGGFRRGGGDDKTGDLFDKPSRPESARFDGSDYVPELDDVRLDSQLGRVWSCMVDRKWRTLRQIATVTGDPEASVSAQLRHLRKERFGEHAVEKRPRGNRRRGLFEYRLTPNLQP